MLLLIGPYRRNVPEDSAPITFPGTTDGEYGWMEYINLILKIYVNYFERFCCNNLNSDNIATGDRSGLLSLRMEFGNFILHLA